MIKERKYLLLNKREIGCIVYETTETRRGGTSGTSDHNNPRMENKEDGETRHILLVLKTNVSEREENISLLSKNGRENRNIEWKIISEKK